MLRFEITHSGQAREVKIEGDDVIIGRHNERTAVGLDLTPDDLVSRTHARVWREAGEVRIEEVNLQVLPRQASAQVENPF